MFRFSYIIGLIILFEAFLIAFPTNHVYAAGSSICNSVQDPTLHTKCTDCMKDADSLSTWTAIGCISTDPDNLLHSILKLAIGMAGGIAFLLILFGGLQIMTSAGNPEQLGAGRELVSSAVTGLLLVIFSIFLLQFIGVNIIGIPGFG